MSDENNLLLTHIKGLTEEWLKNVKETNVHIVAVLQSLQRNPHDTPSPWTIEEFKKMDAKIDSNAKEHRDEIAKHSEKHTESLQNIEKSIASINTNVAKIYTRDEADKKFAGKKTEKWVERGIWIVLTLVITAVVASIISP